MEGKVFHCGEYHPKAKGWVKATYIDEWGGLYCTKHRTKATTSLTKLEDAGTLLKLLAQSVPADVHHALRDEYLRGKTERIKELENKIRKLKAKKKRKRDK